MEKIKKIILQFAMEIWKIAISPDEQAVEKLCWQSR